MEKQKDLIRRVGTGILAFAVLLLLIGTKNYLLFHIAIESASVFIAFSLYIIGTRTYRFSENSMLLFISVAFFYVALLDSAHLLTYKGMNLIPGATTNIATQFWIAGRLLEISSICIVPLFLRRRPVKLWLHLGFGAITALLAASIVSGIFPACYVDGVGLTPFKKGAEILIVLMGAFALIQLKRTRAHTGENVSGYVSLAIVFMMASELCFTFYVDVYGALNGLGHLFKVISYGLLWELVIEEGLNKPYEHMFKNVYQKSIRDQLTGLFNRSGLEEMAKAMFDRAKRFPAAFVVMVLDLDNFKSINDDFGHPEGDLALNEFGKLLRSSFRESDLLARMGGDEFIVFLDGGIEGATLAENRLQQAVAEWKRINPRRRAIGVTLGMALRPVGSDMDLATLLAEADAKMLRDKVRKRGAR
ncbi:MAG: GGDEF domain-containing protein [Rectinemataceae bacterium]